VNRTALALTSACVAALGLVGCGGSTSKSSDQSAAPSQSSAPPQSSAPTQSAPPDPAAEPVRLGCHEYCQQAGGYGAGPDQKPALATVATRGTVTPVNGLVPIDVKCEFRNACEGALLLNAERNGGAAEELGRSDLSVPANSTRTLGVPLSAAGRRALMEDGVLPVDVTVDSNQTLQALPRAEQSNWIGLDIGSIKLAAG
jgi:hypothetical protein